MSNHGANNPYAQQSNQPQLQPQQQEAYPPYPAGQGSFSAPPGPPPQHTGTSAGVGGGAGTGTGTFEEGQFVPEAERGEQREAIEQFEMTRSGPEDRTDRDVAALQGEFPGVDGSLIAAIYGDSQNLGATREMLRELAGGQA